VCVKQKFAAMDVLAVAEPHFYHNPETALQLQSPSGMSELSGLFHTTHTSSMQVKRQCDCNSRFS